MIADKLEYTSFILFSVLVILNVVILPVQSLEVEQLDINNEPSLMPDDSPVLLDESNSFENIKPDFRGLDGTHNTDEKDPVFVSNADISIVQSDPESLEQVEVANGTFEDQINLNNTLNETLQEKNATEAKYRCTLKVLEEGQIPMLQLMNSSSLLRALNPVPNVTSGECALVVFYSPWCIFSAKAAPQFNALPRIFPYFSVYALDVVTYSALNMRYGLVAIPTLFLFYNGKPVARFNESEPVINKIVIFVQKYTGITSQENLTISENEMLGPLSPVPDERRDYILVLSWLIIIACSCGWFLQSSLCHKMVEGLRNTWREAEAQHEHVE